MRKLCNLTAFTRDMAVSLKTMSIAQYFMMRGYTHINVTLGTINAEVSVYLHSKEEAQRVQREMASSFDLKRHPSVTDYSESGKPLFVVAYRHDFECTETYD